MITSKQNGKIKEIRSLSQKKYRYESKKYIVEGVKLVREAFATHQNVECVVVSQGSTFLANGLDTEIIEVSDDVFASISYEENPQGILAVLVMPTERCAETGNSLLLDRISDPGNLGTIIRTAAASGYKNIYLKNCTDPYSPKAVRASMSGVFFVNLFFGGEELLDKIATPIIVAEMNGEDVRDFTPPESFCIAIGNEANGLSEEVKSKAYKTVKIPMQDVESLNAGVAAGILMYSLKFKI